MTDCSWAYGAQENMRLYHDKEWGKETHDERLLFELLSLELMQAGLSWQTILNKRVALRENFCNFEPQKIAALTNADLNRIAADPRIIRNRRKIAAIKNNAEVLCALYPKGQSLNSILWSYVLGKPQDNHWRHAEEVPAQTTLSRQISQDLKKAGFKFVGPTIVYSFLQASGMVNDHLENCSHKYK